MIDERKLPDNFRVIEFTDVGFDPDVNVFSYWMALERFQGGRFLKHKMRWTRVATIRIGFLGTDGQRRRAIGELTALAISIKNE